MAEYTLHCFAQSGNAYKPALMMALCGADWEPCFVDFFNGATRTPEYRAINVMGEVPVLEHKGKSLSQSGVILDYLAETLGKFGPHGNAERREILRWILFDNHKFTSYTATLRYLINFVPNADPAVIAMFRTRAEGAWKVLDTHLAGQEWIVARRPTIADFSLAGYVFWPEEIGVDWNDYPNLRDWSARIAALPGWQHPYQLMPGHPLPAKT
ncbi:MAG: glutathione S-transferase C-terminal domain-containing protein [Sulfuritalea sp.]|nr:glutathione S-transferase C-terminal domain-containing protein [Sulfuritalea sp.]